MAGAARTAAGADPLDVARTSFTARARSPSRGNRWRAAQRRKAPVASRCDPQPGKEHAELRPAFGPTSGPPFNSVGAGSANTPGAPPFGCSGSRLITDAGRAATPSHTPIHPRRSARRGSARRGPGRPQAGFAQLLEGCKDRSINSGRQSNTCMSMWKASPGAIPAVHRGRAEDKRARPVFEAARRKGRWRAPVRTGAHIHRSRPSAAAAGRTRRALRCAFAAGKCQCAECLEARAKPVELECLHAIETAAEGPPVV